MSTVVPEASAIPGRTTRFSWTYRRSPDDRKAQLIDLPCAETLKSWSHQVAERRWQEHVARIRNASLAGFEAGEMELRFIGSRRAASSLGMPIERRRLPNKAQESRSHDRSKEPFRAHRRERAAFKRR